MSVTRGGVRRGGARTGGPHLPFFLPYQALKSGPVTRDSAGGGWLEECRRGKALHFPGAGASHLWG